MAASVNLPPAEPLPMRPDPRLVQACLDWRRGPHCDHETSKALADELLHLRKDVEDKGGELGGLTFRAQEIVRAWRAATAAHPQCRTYASSEFRQLWQELDELAEHLGVA